MREKSLFSIIVLLLLAISALGQGVSLPFTLYGGTADVDANEYVNAYGLGTDLDGDQPLHFDSSEDSLVIQLSGEAKALAFSARVIGNIGTQSNLALMESANGRNWSIHLVNGKTGVRPTTAGKEFKYDLNADTRYIKLIFSIAEGEEVCEVGVGQLRIYDRKLHIDSAGWITYFTDEPIQLPAEHTGYIVKQLEENAPLSIVKMYDGASNSKKHIPANTPVLISGPANPDGCAYELSNASRTIPEGNFLYGNLGNGEIAALEGNYQYYKLAKGANGLGWYYGNPTEAGGVFTMKGFKAYLAIPYSPESSSPVRQAPSFDMIVEETDETGIATGMNETDADAAVKFVENGQIRIRKGEHVYTIMGMMVR